MSIGKGLGLGAWGFGAWGLGLQAGTPAITDAAHTHVRANAMHGGIASGTASLDLVLTSPRAHWTSDRQRT